MSIEPHLGEAEDAYRQQFLRADRALMTYAAVSWVAFTMFFIRSDALLFGQSQLFFALVLSRSLYSIITIWMLFSLRRFPHPQRYDWLIFGWSLLTLFHMSWIEFVRPRSYSGHYTLDVLIIVVLYLVPNRFVFRAVAATLFSGLVLVGLFVYKVNIQPVDRDAIAAACLVANIVGFVISTRLYTYRRRQFQAVLEARQSTAALELLATTDALTGIFNRRKFIDLGTQEFEKFLRYHHPFSVHIIDLDLFKQVNDQFGHHAGDETLKHFTRLVLQHKRDSDIFGRLGGEEFGLILPNTPVEAAAILAERLRQVVRETPARLTTTLLSITLSIGVAEVHADDTEFDDILKRADRLLYRAKHNGRNRVEVGN